MPVSASTTRPQLLICDERTIVFRPIRATDADLLIELHNRLSAQTQYLRFFGPTPRLTPREAHYLGFLRAKNVVVGPAQAGICSVTTSLEKDAVMPAAQTGGSP